MSQERFPPDPSLYPEPSNATTILVLGIIGLFFNLLAPFAWVMGNSELEAIDSGRRAPENRQTANVGRILGIIGTVFLFLSLILVVVVLLGLRAMM